MSSNLNLNIAYFDYVSNDEFLALAKIYSSSDLYLQSYKEGFGLPPLKATAHTTPLTPFFLLEKPKASAIDRANSYRLSLGPAAWRKPYIPFSDIFATISAIRVFRVGESHWSSTPLTSSRTASPRHPAEVLSLSLIHI